MSINFYWLVEPIDNNQLIIIDYLWLYWLQLMIDFIDYRREKNQNIVYTSGFILWLDFR